jgi:sulfite exporter TauE/SafE
MRRALILSTSARALAGTGIMMAAQTLGTRPVMIEVGVMNGEASDCVCVKDYVTRPAK